MSQMIVSKEPATAHIYGSLNQACIDTESLSFVPGWMDGWG